jgi:hypothetical protein
MSLRIRKPGRMPTKPLDVAPYVDYLTERLKDENKGHLRKFIRAKIRMLNRDDPKYGSRPHSSAS